MRGQTVSFIYVFNIVMQAIFSILFSTAIFFGLAWLLVRFLSVPEWAYIPFIIAGLLLGIVSAVKFILSAMASLERLEGEREKKNKE